MSEILSRLPPHVRVLSTTTDGWLSDVTEEEARAAASGPVCRHFAQLRALVDPAGSDEILEVKHRALAVLVAKTRHGITVTPVPGSKLICARAGHRLPEDAPSPRPRPPNGSASSASGPTPRTCRAGSSFRRATNGTATATSWTTTAKCA